MLVKNQYFFGLRMCGKKNKNGIVTTFKTGSLVQFNVTINRQCYFHGSHLLNQTEDKCKINGNKWAQDPLSYLTEMAVNIVSYGHSEHLNHPPMFKMSDIECVIQK